MQINPKLLVTFLSVADSASFRDAANLTRRSPSAVSMQIRSLEEQLGISLFHRTTRRVALTEDGKRLLAAARRSVNELETALREIKGTVDLQQGHFSVSSTPSIACSIMPRLVIEFQSLYPNLDIELTEQTSADLFESLRRQDISIGIGPYLPGRADLDFNVLWKDPIYLICPMDTPLSNNEGVLTKEVLSLKTLIVPSVGILRSVLTEFIEKNGISADIKHKITRAPTMIALVEAGVGPAVIPKHVIADLGNTTFRAVPILDFPISWDVSIITLRGAALSPGAQRFADFIRERVEAPFGNGGV